MRTHLLSAFLIICCLSNPLHAQDTTIRNNMIYKTWINILSDPSVKLTGAVYELKDSSLIVSHSTYVRDYNEHTFKTTEIDISDIELIKTRKKTNVRYGLLIGTVTGFAIGALIGLNTESECDDWMTCMYVNSKGLRVTFIGIPCALLGGAIGAGMGANIKISIPINGSMDNYNLHKEKLKRRTITYQ